MADKHGHHIVPKALIENFALDGKRVFKYRIAEGNVFPTNARDSLRRRHYHSVVKEDGSVDHNLFEDEFSKFESFGIEAIKKLVRKESLNSDDREWLASFIALQHLRTPVARADNEKLLIERLKATSFMMDRRNAFPDLPEGLKKFGKNLTELIESGAINLEITLPQVTMQGISAIASATPIIARMNYCLVEAIGNHYFLLSDNPVSIYDSDYEAHGQGLALAYRHVEIVLPVGARHCILATPKPCPKLLTANRARIDEINKRSAIFADEEAIFPINAKGTMRLLQAYSSDGPGTVTQTIDTDGSTYVHAKRVAYNSERGKRAYLSCKPLIAEGGAPKAARHQ